MLDDKRIETDINNLGGKVNRLDTSFQVCQATKGKDIEQLQDRCTLIEAVQGTMTNEIKDLVKTQNKIFGGLAIGIIVLQFIMPIIMKKFIGS